MANNGGVPVPIFQSTLSMRRATLVSLLSTGSMLFQSTLSMRRATGHERLRMDRTRHFNPRSP